MFHVNDTISARHEQIRRLDPGIGVIVAAADFEWTVRRAILALGTRPTAIIRQDAILRRASGLGKYQKAWDKEVYPRTGKSLPELIPNWDFFCEKAYPLRHRLVHGAKGTVGADYARERMDCILAASRALNDFADSLDEPLYGRRIVRLKPRK